MLVSQVLAKEGVICLILDVYGSVVGRVQQSCLLFTLFSCTVLYTLFSLVIGLACCSVSRLQLVVCSFESMILFLLFAICFLVSTCYHIDFAYSYYLSSLVLQCGILSYVAQLFIISVALFRVGQWKVQLQYQRSNCFS